MHISNPQEAGQNKGFVIILVINVSQGYSGKILGVVIYLKICRPQCGQSYQRTGLERQIYKRRQSQQRRT